MLTGSVEPVDSPLSLILGKFQECGPDQGYGPATYIPARAVKAFHDALSSLSDEEISSRYDPIAMVRDQVYIGQALADQGKEGVEYLMSDIQRLRKFVAEGAAKSMDAFGLIT